MASDTQEMPETVIPFDWNCLLFGLISVTEILRQVSILQLCEQSHSHQTAYFSTFKKEMKVKLATQDVFQLQNRTKMITFNTVRNKNPLECVLFLAFHY